MANSDNTINILLKAQDEASAILRKASQDISRAADESAGHMDKNADKADRMGGKWLGLGAAAGAVAGVVTSTISGAISGMTNLLDDAITRVDTLNNATRTFNNMGFDDASVTRAMSAIKSSVLGLPTSLDAAVRYVQLLASATGDLDKSQQIFRALNDGIIGFGGSADQVSTVVTQLSQSFAGGRLQAQDWNSMLDGGLGPALNGIAKQMHITTDVLKQGLSDGSISVSKFQDALISLDKNGGGGLASLQTIAHDSTSGIATGMANAKTAVTRGLADIITALGSADISNGISAIGSGIEGALKGAAPLIGEVAKGLRELGTNVANFVKPFLDDFVKEWKEQILPVLERNKPLIKDIAKALGVELGGSIVFTLALINVFAKGLGYLLDAMTNARKGIVDAVVYVQDTWSGMVKFVAGAVIKIQTFIKDSQKAITEAAHSITNAVKDAVTNAFNGIVNFITHLPEEIGYALGFIGEKLTIFATKDVPNFIAGVIGFFQGLPDAIGKAAQDAWKAVTDWFNKTGDDMGTSASNGVDDVVKWFSSLPDRVASAVAGFWDSSSKALTSFAISFGQWAKNTVDDVVNWFTALPGRIAAAITSAAKSVAGAATDLWSRFLGGANAGAKAASGHALGTNFAPGGLTMVGETGPELVAMPTGSKVFTASETRQMVSGGGSASGIQIGELHIHNEMDEQRFLANVGRRLALS